MHDSEIDTLVEQAREGGRTARKAIRGRVCHDIHGLALRMDQRACNAVRPCDLSMGRTRTTER